MSASKGFDIHAAGEEAELVSQGNPSADAPAAQAAPNPAGQPRVVQQASAEEDEPPPPEPFGELSLLCTFAKPVLLKCVLHCMQSAR